MSERRTRTLGYAVVATFIVGVVIAAVPFIGSLKPSARADALVGKRRVDISDFEPNSYRLIRIEESRLERTSQSTRFHNGRSWLVIRENSGEFTVFGLPTWEESIPMPRDIWGQHEGFCFDLGPANTESKFDESTIIQCNDPDEDTAWFAEYWYWSIDGKNVSGELPDLSPVRTLVEGDVLAINDFWGG